jgi:arylsulfatase
MRHKFVIAVAVFLVVCADAIAQSTDTSKPNIVLMVQDNLGWGEVGCYGGGILRGAETPRIDTLASEGVRLLNFNVEAQCVPSRSALMTGRYPIRSGTHSVVWGMLYGMTQWERTIAELLSEQGYATAMYGKWHLGDTPGRFPTDQGFDEWYGIPNTTDEAVYAEGFQYDDSVSHRPYILKSTKGKTPEKVKEYTRETRRTIDSELVDHTIDFMKRSVGQNKPFFVYLPFTQVHIPTEPHPDFKGKTGNGRWADVLTEMDHRVGQVLDAIDDLEVRKNTIVIWMSENGPEEIFPHNGARGPWKGTYFTGYEGSLRTSFLIRWPENIPSGGVSNEIVHITDVYSTLAKAGGAEVPQDRIVDGVDQMAFFKGESEKSAREGFPVYNGSRLFGYKWRNWKLLLLTQETMGSPLVQPGMPRLYNLLTDMREDYDLVHYGGKDGGELHYWVMPVMMKKIVAHKGSLAKEPPIQMGTPDPYVPAP